jgi:hypothetical protein
MSKSVTVWSVAAEVAVELGALLNLWRHGVTVAEGPVVTGTSRLSICKYFPPVLAQNFPREIT